VNRDTVIRAIRNENPTLRERFGVKSISLFGSVSRNEATTTSDVDLLVEFSRPTGYFGLFALQDYLVHILGCPVDIGTPASLKPRIRKQVMGDLIRVT
jgi:predicted nucleotidyltransferase